MWRPFALVTLILVVATCGAAQAAPELTLPISLGWARYEVVRGQIRIVNSRFNQTKSHTLAAEDGSRRQVYSVNVSDAKLSSIYEDESTAYTLRIAIEASGEVRLTHRTHTVPAQVLAFYQAPRGSVELSVGQGVGKRTILAKSLWHLMLSEPVLCRTRLTPLLETLRPDWRLSERGEELEAHLIALAAHPPAIDRRQVTALIAQLGHPEYTTRRSAYTTLLRMGHAILPVLAEVDPVYLDREQRFRIAELKRAFASTLGDTPRRAAHWLESDKHVWLVLMSHPDVDCRRLAMGRMSAIYGTKVAFDPAADEPQRIAQLHRLSRRVGR